MDLQKEYSVEWITSFLLRLLLVTKINATEAAASSKTPNGEKANCVSLYSCVPLLNGLATMEPLALKFVKESHCGCDSSGPLACCGSLSTFIPTTKGPVTEKPHKLVNPKSLLPSRYICGYQGRDDRFDFRAISTHIDEYPWMTIIYYKNYSQIDCGGVLINRRYVLTLGSCLNNPRLKISHIRLGEYDISHNGIDCVANPDYPECTDLPMDYAVEEVIIHETFDRNFPFYDNDIGLIRLAREVTYTDYIRPICLPDSDNREPSVGDEVFSSGWGVQQTGPHSEATVNVKKNVRGNIITTDACKVPFQSSSNVKITQNSICFREIMSGNCLGDNGGPIMKQYGTQWQLEGIFSFGSTTGLCRPNGINVGIRVSSYMPWILSKLKK